MQQFNQDTKMAIPYFSEDPASPCEITAACGIMGTIHIF
jgi:hypothetical protein